MADLDMYGERVADASALIREFAKTEYYHYFQGDPEQALRAFIAMLDQAEEKGRQEQAARIAELEAKLAEVPRWISVKDRLPPLYKTVALLNDDRWMNTGNDEFDTNWHGAGWLCEFGQQFWSVIGETRSMTLDSVTHWCDFPAAPAPSEVL